MARGIERNRRRRSPTEPDPADLLWELDEGTEDEAWTTAWLTWREPARLAFRCSRLEAPRSREIEAAIFLNLWGQSAPPAREAYEALQGLRRQLPYSAELSHRQQRWLTVVCLIAEAGIANSTGGGLLPGTLLLDVVRSHPDEWYADRLEDARMYDALGDVGEPRHAKATRAFRDAWRAGRYRLAYALARAARGLP